MVYKRSTKQCNDQNKRV